MRFIPILLANMEVLGKEVRKTTKFCSQLQSVNVPVSQDVQNLDLKMVLSLAAFPKPLHLFREQMLSPADIWLKHMAVDLQVRKNINKICMT